ncbi:hypothetical protein [Streptomyces albidoflavus]|nr:hypothetical protein [Streptomyces albidoflavus]
MYDLDCVHPRVPVDTASPAADAKKTGCFFQLRLTSFMSARWAQ